MTPQNSNDRRFHVPESNGAIEVVRRRRSDGRRGDHDDPEHEGDRRDLTEQVASAVFL